MTVSDLPVGILPSKSLIGYNDELKAGLANGYQFTELVDQLLLTNDANQLLTAVLKLINFDLNTKQVQFPNQYQKNDWYLLFMTRLLELHQNSNFSLASATDHQELGLFLAGSGVRARFQFELDTSYNGGAFFTEIETKRRLFYLNLAKKELFFNSHDLVELFGTELRAIISADARMTAIHVMMDFAAALSSDFGFTVDYNILTVANTYQFEFKEANLAPELLDKLFVLSAKDEIIMQNATDGYGAKLALPGNIIVNLLQNIGNDNQPFWYLTVIDANERQSWFDVLMNYDFIYQWYQTDLASLEIQANQRVFGAKPNHVEANRVQVEVLQPHYSEEG